MITKKVHNNKNEEEKKFKLKIFTEDNLQDLISKGWNVELMIQGKMKTLTSKSFFVEVSNFTTIKELKCIIEDQEGYNRNHMYIKKRTKYLDDDKTLYDYFVTEDDCLLLINPGKNKKLKQQDGKINKMSTKTKQRGVQTGTMTISEAEAKKLPQKDWYEDPENYLLSGPQNQPHTPKSPSSPSKVQNFSFSSSVNGGKSKNEKQEIKEDPREKVRKATEERLKKLQK
eukprot:gene8482-304_t